MRSSTHARQSPAKRPQGEMDQWWVWRGAQGDAVAEVLVVRQSWNLVAASSARASLSPVVWIGGHGADTNLQCIGAGTGHRLAAGVGF